MSAGLYTSVQSIARDLEHELKRLNRWDEAPLPAGKFVDMGAFGCNTMTFEQWMQFVLLERIREIVKSHGDFPDESSLAAYAVRYFDGDDDADHLRSLLEKLDDLINDDKEVSTQGVDDENTVSSVALGDRDIPAVVKTLADLLPQFEGDVLESQLQTFDTFTMILDPSARHVVSGYLHEAAGRTQSAASRQRILLAAEAITRGEHATEPYDHEKAMKTYLENFKKGYPGKE